MGCSGWSFLGFGRADASGRRRRQSRCQHPGVRSTLRSSAPSSRRRRGVRGRGFLLSAVYCAGDAGLRPTHNLSPPGSACDAFRAVEILRGPLSPPTSAEHLSALPTVCRAATSHFLRFFLTDRYAPPLLIRASYTSLSDPCRTACRDRDAIAATATQSPPASTAAPEIRVPPLPPSSSGGGGRGGEGGRESER